MNTPISKPSETVSTVALVLGSVVGVLIFATSALAAEAAYGVSYQPYQPTYQPAPYQYTAQPQAWNLFWNQIDNVRYNLIDIPFNQIRQDMQPRPVVYYPQQTYYPSYPVQTQQYPQQSYWNQGTHYQQYSQPYQQTYSYPSYPQYNTYNSGYPWTW